VVRFADKASHLIFLEPHGLDTFEIYPNGLSTSLPPDVQLAFLRTIPGLEHVEVTRWGYAVEYDFVVPTQLWPSLQTRAIGGLFCAGQLNGTTGYEEAAIQGLMAGINASRLLQHQAPVVVRRDEGYLGVLVDDLVSKGTDEPYRMFTSRAEHRLVLREDNVAARLLPLADEIGLASLARRQRAREFEARVEQEVRWLRETRIVASDATNAMLTAAQTPPLTETTRAETLLKRPQVALSLVYALAGRQDVPDPALAFRVEVESTYGGFLERAHKEVARERALDDEALPEAIFQRLLSSTNRLPGISNEVREKLLRLRPQTLGQASRVSGITPAAIGLLAVEARRLRAGGGG
jgi:tRNA uridine 5-carboxymethylaminomethyl modification enzyme